MPIKIYARKAAWFSVTAFAIVLIALGLNGTAAVNVARANDVSDDAVVQEAIADARFALDDAEAHMDTLSFEYDTLKDEVNRLQNQIDEMLTHVFRAQQAVIEGRSALSRSAVYEYQSGGSTGFLINILLESDNFSELEHNLFYLDKIMNFQAARIAEQQKLSNRLQNAVNALNAQKDAQDKKLLELDKKRAEAQALAAKASAQLQNAQKDEAARIAELQRKAEQMSEVEIANEPVIAEGANTIDRADVVPSGTPVEPTPSPAVPDTDNNNDNTAAGDNASSGGSGEGASGGGDIGWASGVASAYGGSTDPYTPNPGVTATGAVCDDFSMGVAIPMSWENYSSYFGHIVEISYNGQTVFATINDCGYMGGGTRVLDLQPGVWKAFGFSSCLDWGLRSVRYRIL